MYQVFSKTRGAAVMAAALVCLAGLPVSASADGAAADKSKAERIARGSYIVTTSGCNDCHTPFKLGPNGPEPDMERMLSGHPESLEMPEPPVLPDGPWQVVASGTSTAWSGAWGISYTANLTPDKETGLGKWTLKNFRDTIRTGRHLGRGRVILPPMPIQMYKNFTDEDLEAIYLYLKSIPAIRNKVPVPVTPGQE